jgi:enoyl-CoA hydratase/carnithine racemase
MQEIDDGRIITERSESMLRAELNRPTKKNAMTSSMYVTHADVFNEAAKNEQIRVAEAKEAFSAFLEKRPPNFTKTATPVAAE